MPTSPQHLDRLRLRHLRLLELINAHGSLRAVGAVLNLTQPAVSQMVKDLEFAFGAELVHRSVRGVTLSPAGRLALQRARSGLATLDQLAGELSAGDTMTLRIGTNTALMFNIIPAALARMGTGRDRVGVTLQTGLVQDMIRALADGRLDCYVGRIDWDQIPEDLSRVLVHDPVATTDLVLVCPAGHTLADKPNLSARDLADLDWALPTRESSNRIALETAMRNAGTANIRAAIEIAGEPSALIALATDLNLLTCVPRLVLDAYGVPDDLRILDVADLNLPSIHIGLATLSGHVETGALQAFREALRKAAPGHAADNSGLPFI